MTGHHDILAMRRSGRKPTFVWVSDHEKQTLDGVTVRVTGDTPEALDLRFLVGVTALVEGPDQARVERIAECCAAVAKRVIATTFASPGITRITDTEGVMTWPT
jgi:hypothetical protein